MGSKLLFTPSTLLQTLNEHSLSKSALENVLLKGCGHRKVLKLEN